MSNNLHPAAEISAKVIAHSTWDGGQDLISVETHAPKFLDAEIEKHGYLASNSSSDRAIPYAKSIDAPIFYPEDLRLEQRGMQGYEKASEDVVRMYHSAINNLHTFIDQEFDFFRVIDKPLHKQHLNRNLLPFSMQNKLITGTREGWDAFFKLREAGGADPAITTLAKKIREAIDDSIPVILEAGDWHTPYVDEGYVKADDPELGVKLKSSTARCARISYMNHDGTNVSFEKDMKTYDLLFKEVHATPFEHPCTPLVGVSQAESITLSNPPRLKSGRFHDWQQYRKVFGHLG